MTIARLLPLPVHAALEVALASIVIATPFWLGFDAAALVVAVVIGVLMMGTGLAATGQVSGRGGSAGLRVSAHADVDFGLALSSALAGLVFAAAGDVAAAGLFVAAAAAQVLLAAITRYSARA